MGIKLGICVIGAFARSFIPLFKAHPLVSEIALADLIPDLGSAPPDWELLDPGASIY